MGKLTWLAIPFLAFSLLLALPLPSVWTAGEYTLTFSQIERHKAFFDDPRPFFKELPYRKILPPEVYAHLSYNVEAMKRAWAEVVGFKAPDVVGRIAPEIQPGTYTYRDKERSPGLKKLMIPLHYESFFKPGGPPHAGNFPEIQVTPTRQYYGALPVAEATRNYMGKSRLDDQGYLITESYQDGAGLPFPRPSGRFKPQQIIYNWEKRYSSWDNQMMFQHAMGCNRNLTLDFDSLAQVWVLRLQGRVMMEPYGWYDERARRLGELGAFSFSNLAPRDLYGNVVNVVAYLDRDKFNQFMIYINVLRRVRKLSGTDLQDQAVGQDAILDDFDGFGRKLSPKRYPWKFELMEEREYLVPAYDQDGSTYFSRKGLEWRNIKFERRPLYVVKLTQTDPNYIYGHSILYIDQETFLYHHIENYDQKGRLYRTVTTLRPHLVEMGIYPSWQAVLRDYLDLHSTFTWILSLPATWLTRKHVDLQSLVNGAK